MQEKNYTLGKGRVFFDAFVKGTLNTQGERYFGDTMEANITSESESLDHYDNDAGVRVKDASVLLELNRTGTLITENISVENLALFFLGNSSTLSQAAVAAQTSTFATVGRGLYYQLGTSASRPEGVRKVANVSVVNRVTPATTYTEGTDYTIDLALARIRVLESGSITEADGITVTFDIEAATFTRVVTAADAEIKGALRYIATNPQGELMDYFMPYVSLKPNGDFALKSGDEFQQLGFQFEVLKKDDATEALYINGRPA